jgi:NADH dehydrogenase FAD-containing subunit
MGAERHGILESVWIAESDAPQPTPSLAARLSADIAVIGGGFTGVSTAWHLRQRHPELFF